MRVQRSSGRRRSIPIILALFCLGTFGSLISVASSDNAFVETIAGPEAENTNQGGNGGVASNRRHRNINGVGVALIGDEGGSTFTVDLPYYEAEQVSLEERRPATFNDVSLSWMLALNNGGTGTPGATGNNDNPGSPGFAGSFTPLGNLSGPGVTGSGSGTPVGGTPGDEAGNTTPEGDNQGGTENPGDSGTPVNNNPGNNNPGSNTPGNDNPGSNNPGNDNPGDNNPVNNNPGNNNPGGGNTGDDKTDDKNTDINNPDNTLLVPPGDEGAPGRNPEDKNVETGLRDEEQGELAEEVPEPGSMAIMLTGLGLFAAVTRKRKPAKP